MNAEIKMLQTNIDEMQKLLNNENISHKEMAEEMLKILSYSWSICKSLSKPKTVFDEITKNEERLVIFADAVQTSVIKKILKNMQKENDEALPSVLNAIDGIKEDWSQTFKMSFEEYSNQK